MSQVGTYCILLSTTVGPVPTMNMIIIYGLSESVITRVTTIRNDRRKIKCRERILFITFICGPS